MDGYSNRYASRRSVQARPPPAQRRLRACKHAAACCQSRQATWTPWARSFLHLRTDVDDAVRLLSMTERNPTPFSFKFIVLVSSHIKLSCPRGSPLLCEPSAPQAHSITPSTARAPSSSPTPAETAAAEFFAWPRCSSEYHTPLAAVSSSFRSPVAHALAPSL